ncbi:MAG: L,D-transpeptidase family protein [Bacteroidales bacterium]|nr:L,D-transpeptidase family protein [Bacteroidales bacterium]
MDITSEDTLVQQFYVINHESLYWFSSRKDIKRAAEWLKTIESANSFGLISDTVQIDQIRTALSNKNKIDIILKEKTDIQITGLVLNFIKDLQEGVVHFDYDEVNVPRDSVYIYQVRNSRYKGSVSKIVSRLDCKDHDYLVLKKYLKDSITDKNTFKYKAVVLAMNYRRYLTMNHQSEYILVNIPTAEAEYYRDDLLALKMRTVAGKKINQTPTIASHITSIVTFPFWNVPHTIAVKEILPKAQKDDNYLEQHNFEVVDAKGNVLDDSELNWKGYTEKNFPYFFRQSTGADNSLGVIKFNLKNPFSIFLHATSWQGAFAKDYRFLSHGCIRLEKPFELADALLRGMIDIQELKDGKKFTESNIIELHAKVPVYLIYVPVTVEGDKVTFLQDVYGLVK